MPSIPTHPPVPCVSPQIEGITHFVQQFVANEKADNEGTPTLAKSLDVERGHPDIAASIGRLGDAPVVLFQGYTAPSNAQAFRDFLALFGSLHPSIHALDLHDMPAIYRQMGIPVPGLNFHVSDACDKLSGLSDGQVSILIQHGLGNCCPPSRWPDFQRQGARLLSPHGFALMLISELVEPELLTSLSMPEFEQITGVTWDSLAVHLDPLELDPDRIQPLLGKAIFDPETKTHTLITAPVGRLEFFAPFSQFEASLHQAGLVVRSRLTSTGIDSNGILCQRSQCLVSHR
jgi:hypothetical protein